MTATRISRPVRVVCFAFLAIGTLWLVYSRLVSAQSVLPQPAVRVLDLESTIRDAADLAAFRFLSIRANDAGLFVWAEAGESRVSGARAAAVYQINESGRLLRTTPLPRGAHLTQTGDFGLDYAGNVYFLQKRPGVAEGSDLILLIKVDPRGEIVEEHPLPGRPATFAVGGSGRVSLLTNEAEISSPDAPSIAIARGHAPRRDESGAPPRWLPLLEQTPGGELVLVDGLPGTFEIVAGLIPGERRPIASAELQTAVRHIQEAHAAHAGKPTGSLSFQPALRSSCVDERGNLSFTLMGTRPSHGIIVVRVDSNGNTLPALRLEAPVDKNRPDVFGRPRPDGEAALMFPHDLAVWQGEAFVLGVHGLLAIYEVS